MERSGLLRSVSSEKPVGPAANLADERPGSCKHNLPAVNYRVEMARELAAGLIFHSASAAPQSKSRSSGQRLQGEWLVLGVPTSVADVAAGCGAPEASIQRYSADVVRCTW